MELLFALELLFRAFCCARFLLLVFALFFIATQIEIATQFINLINQLLIHSFIHLCNHSFIPSRFYSHSAGPPRSYPCSLKSSLLIFYVRIYILLLYYDALNSVELDGDNRLMLNCYLL